MIRCFAVIDWFRALLLAMNAHYVMVFGSGTFNCGGEEWWPSVHERMWGSRRAPECRQINHAQEVAPRVILVNTTIGLALIVEDSAEEPSD